MAKTKKTRAYRVVVDGEASPEVFADYIDAFEDIAQRLKIKELEPGDVCDFTETFIEVYHLC